MMKLALVKPVGGVLVALASAVIGVGGCARALRITDPPSGAIVLADGGVPGYQHGVDRSRFSVGARSRRLVEHGYLKLVGDAGTLAIDRVNGSAYGVPKAHAYAANLRPYGKSPTDHDAFVRAYFVKNGIPSDQIAGVKGRTLVEATGRSDEKERAVPRVIGYYTVLERAVDGIPIVDSFAWARVSVEGQIVEEAVYWPTISRGVMTRVKQLRDIRSDSQRRRELTARFPADTSNARLVIRHSSASSHDPFEAFASVDVLVKVMAPGEQRLAKDANGSVAEATMSHVSYVRHFDVEGREIFLPQERFRLAQQYPARKK